jgi:hypothetical protein
MRHTALVNAIESLVDSTCADSVKDALAAVCAAKAEHIRASYSLDASGDPDADMWDALATKLAAVPNLGV